MGSSLPFEGHQVRLDKQRDTWGEKFGLHPTASLHPELYLHRLKPESDLEPSVRLINTASHND